MSLAAITNNFVLFRGYRIEPNLESIVLFCQSLSCLEAEIEWADEWVVETVLSEANKLQNCQAEGVRKSSGINQKAIEEIT